jgi:PAS domain S-box-containing protein
MRNMTKNNANQQQRLNEFEPVMRNMLGYLAQTIALRDEQGLKAAVERDSIKTGKDLTDHIRAILADMSSEEKRLVTEQKKKYDQARVGFHRNEAVFVFAMGLISFFTSFLLVRSIMCPLRTLSRGVEQLGAGNYATRINLPCLGEFDQLANAFNLMAEAIQARTQELKSIVCTMVDGLIILDSHGGIRSLNPAAERLFDYTTEELVGKHLKYLLPQLPDDTERRVLAANTGYRCEVNAERKNGLPFPLELTFSEMSVGGSRMFTCLVRDISERKAMERMKDEFISTVSHELRTPLTSIQGALGLILGGAAGDLPEKSIKLLTIANNNCKRLVRLINDILDLEKFESGKMAFDIKPIEIMPLVAHCIELNQAYADEFGVTFVVTYEQAGAVVLADSDRFTQVLTNLLSNAAKFSHRGGQVDVATSIIKQRLRLSVTDYGTGIKEEFRDQIFKKFTQEDSTNTRQKGGTGLGLSISKAIIEKLGGIIDYESEPDKKTTFFIELPLYRDEETLPATLNSEPSKEHLLILEDDPDVATLLRILLAKRGYAADIAYTAEQAKHMLNSRPYDAMTLDLALPGQSGIDFFRELRGQEPFKHLPVIVVSASADQVKQELSGEALAIVDWLSKPIDEDRLGQALTHALRRNGRRTRILHVEDDPDIVDIVAALLQNTAEIDVAMDLATAMEKLQQDYDLVILDIELPDGSGETLLPLLANRDKAIPVVIFSASEIETADSQHVLANFIKSKTSNEELVNKIESILKSRRQ